MRLFNNMIDPVRRLIASPLDELGMAQRRLRYAIDLSRHCLRELKRDRANQMAAALTYRTIFSLMPMLVLAIVVLQAFDKGRDPSYLDTFKEMIVETLVPESMVDEDSDETAASETVTDESGEVVNADKQAVEQDSFKETRKLFTRQIDDFFNKLSSVNFGGIGTVGLLIFIYGSTALLSTIEKSFNTIFAVEEGRPWYMRITYYYTFITVGPIVLLAGQVLQKQFLDILTGASWLRWSVAPLLVMTPVIAAWLVLFAIFMILPNTRVRWKPAALGALVGAVLWVISKELFAIYIGNTGITSLYGALGLVPLFLIWLFLTWFIVLFALELTYALQTLRREQIQQAEAIREAKMLGDPLWLLPMMVQIGKVFGDGQTIDHMKLSRALGLSQRAVTDMGRVLENAGLVHRVQDEDQSESGSGGYSLALPPDRLPLTRLLEVGRDLAAQSARPADGSTLPGKGVLDSLAEAQAQAVGEMTLAQAIDAETKQDTESTG